MMTNLFSVFDPSSSFMTLNWTAIFLVSVFLVPQMWTSKPNKTIIKEKVVSSLWKEVYFTLKKTSKSQEIMILMIFMTIIMMNFMALYPQVFSPTSHLSVTLPISLTTWAGIMLFGWLKNTNHMLSHLVPQGTPGALMSFMVLIELTSNIIRPITLCVRLTANLIAGHLLMTLLGNSLMSISLVASTLGLLAPLILTILESAVACIQAYVFMTLTTLYITEVK